MKNLKNQISKNENGCFYRNYDSAENLTYNNINMYITKENINFLPETVQNYINENLDRFIEFQDENLKYTITNTGLIIFENASNEIISAYDLFYIDELALNDIQADLIPLISYNKINNLTGIRKINFSQNKFLYETKILLLNNYYYFINADGCIDNNRNLSYDNKTGYFKSTNSIENEFEKILFNYKPLFIIEVFNEKNEAVIDNIILRINNIEMKKQTNFNYFFLDVSNFENKEKITLTIESEINGFIEVR